MMKWKKLGKIFEPTEYCLPNNCKEFSQSPQVLILEGRIRIYFSTRSKDEANQKYYSHIAYADFSKDFNNVLEVAEQEVIPLGPLGSFDEHGIFPINVLEHNNRILAYTCGWSRRVSVSVETAIGFAESFDKGKTFHKLGHGPIMAASLNEPFLVGDAFVKHYEGRFHMWYMFGKEWKSFSNDSVPDRIYKIGHATSTDGINWNRESGKQVISNKLNEDESMALPSVAFFNGYYHMVFCYRESYDFRKNSNRGYRIGYACSKDLVSWTRDDDFGGISTSINSWDSDMMCYPHLFILDEKLYLLYNGNEFGRFGFGLSVLEYLQ